MPCTGHRLSVALPSYCRMDVIARFFMEGLGASAASAESFHSRTGNVPDVCVFSCEGACEGVW